MAQTFISHSCTAEMSTPDHLGLPELPRLPHGSPLGWHVLLYQFVWRKTVVYRGGGRFFGGSCLACTSSWVWCLLWRRKKKRKRNRKMRWERRSRKSYNMKLVCTWPSNCSSTVFLHKNSVIQPALNVQQAGKCLGLQHKGKLSLAGDESFPKITCFE